MDKQKNVEVRLAQPEDKDAVLAICDRTWENQADYIPLVFDKWLADPNGKIFLALIDGVPVAMSRILLLSDQEAWWEGLRVHYSYRGQGLVGVLRSHIEQYLQQTNVSLSRKCTSSANEIVKGMMARRGRQIVGKYVSFRGEPIESSLSQLMSLNSNDFSSAWELVTNSSFFPSNSLYLSKGAKWQELTSKQLSDRLAAGLVWGIKKREQLVGIAIQSYLESVQNILWIGYLKANTEVLPSLLKELRLLANRQSLVAVGGIFSNDQQVLDSLNIAGYKQFEPQEYWVYEWNNL